MDIHKNIDAQNLSDNSLGVESETLPIRCPECLKLFSVRVQSMVTARPRFQCKSCSQKFYVMYPECLGIGEVVGIPIGGPPVAQTSDSTVVKNDDIESKVVAQAAPSENESLNEDPLESPAVVEESTFHCPKCSHPYKGGEDECGHCGLLFSKYEFVLNKEEGEPESNKELNLAWKSLVTNYTDTQAHQDFIDFCHNKKQLDFAAYKYKQICRLSGYEDTAQLMMNRIEKIMLADSGYSLSDKKRKPRRRFRFSIFVAVLGLSMVAVGYSIPALRNMVGVGVAMTFLSFAIGVYFR